MTARPTCASCGAAVHAGMRFCGACGTALAIGDAVTGAPATAETVEPRDAATFAPSSPGGARRPSSSGGWLTSSDSISHGRFAPGAIVDHRYRIIGLLGRGGMGEVYRADDLRLGQPVALKFLPAAVSRDATRLAQFHNEVRTARQVSHPNICRVYDIGEVEGHLFLSMEFVPGEDLATSLRRIGRFPDDKATEIARQLCAGLAAAHERGVVHRDLKLANVMLDEAGKVRVMDFGLAVVGEVENVRAGTPAYMAPEQLLGKEVTARSDIYALGLVLYELYTGRRAFAADTINDLVEQHQSGEVTPPGTLVSHLDPAIDRAIMRCLERDPARRPSSALAVAAALPGGDPLAAALAAGETPSPQMVAAAGEGAGLSRRAAVALFVAIVAGLAASYGLAVRANPLDQLRPEFGIEVMAQKTRESLAVLGYGHRARDEAYSFAWNGSLISHLSRTDRAALAPARWSGGGPPLLLFRYRRSDQPLAGSMFHHDLLTPGLVTRTDPPPIEPGMIEATLDHRGRLLAFEAIPAQVQETAAGPAAVDWPRVLALAGLDASALQPASPQWHWLASSDTRVAWTGTWPGTEYPLRVEAAALHGRAVALQTIGPWTTPWRTPSATTGSDIALVTIVFALGITIIGGAGLLARRNLRDGRGDRSGAFRLAAAMVTALWLLWILQTHATPSPSLVGNFMLAICTTTFYGVVFWTMYLALEPFVRRHWPQTLVSWTTILSGRVRDPIVGRDVLVGALFGVAVALFVRITFVIGWEEMAWGQSELLGSAREAAARW